MNLGPVIVRELRSQSRQVFTYWLRVLGAGALILVAWFYSQSPRFVSLNNGCYLFVSLHMTLYWVLWLLVPLLCADCISREKRQGTLCLLFLTPLKARDIVLAKGIAHGLRAITLCLSVLPVLTIPFLMGGITWTHGLLSVLINSGALCWALLGGLLASAWNKRWTAALVLSVLLSGVFHCVYAVMLGLAMWPTFPAPPFFSGSTEPQSLWQMAAAGEIFAGGVMALDNFSRGVSANNQMQWILRTMAVCGVSFL